MGASFDSAGGLATAAAAARPTSVSGSATRPWSGSGVHRGAAVALIAGCAAVVAGLFVPAFAPPVDLTGAAILEQAGRAVGSLSENLEDALRASQFLGSTILLELYVVVLVDVLCLGLFAFLCAVAVLKYVVARRSASVLVGLAPLLLVVSWIYVAIRLATLGKGVGDRAGGLVADALTSIVSRSGGALDPAAGTWLYAGGAGVVLVATVVMARVERRARRLARGA